MRLTSVWIRWASIACSIVSSIVWRLIVCFCAPILYIHLWFVARRGPNLHGDLLRQIDEQVGMRDLSSADPKRCCCDQRFGRQGDRVAGAGYWLPVRRVAHHELIG